MFDRIIVPVAPSPPATHLIGLVRRLPARKIVLVRVEPNFQVLAPGPLSNFRPDWRAVRAEQVQDELRGSREQLGERGAPVELAVRFSDDVAGEIIDLAADGDLIVMATQARGVGGSLLFGSTADRVARHAPVPVLLVRAGAGSPEADSPRRLIVPLDGSELAEAAVPVAAKLAAALSLPVLLVRVLEGGRNELAEQAGPGALAEASAYLDQHVAHLAAEGVTAGQEVRAGEPAPALLALVSPEDLVVMTSHGRNGILRWLLGSVADKLVRQAAAPVLLVPAPGRGRAAG